jgi:hypothetical protein
MKETIMSDDVYRQRRKINSQDLDGGLVDESPNAENDPLAAIRKVQQAAANEAGRDSSEQPLAKGEAPFEIGGAMPQSFKDALARKAKGGPQVTAQEESEEEDLPDFMKPARRTAVPKTPAKSNVRVTGSDQFEEAMSKLAGLHQWEEFEFPSMGRFYKDIPATVHVRPMTGEEEQILATPRFVKKGKAIDMIFDRCIKEKINTEDLLSVDRTHLLIFLRGISYTPEYDVEIKCPECGIKFQTVIDLNSLEVEDCPQDFGPDQLEGVLPVSGFKYRYRLSLGKDEQQISQYRDKKIQDWGDQSEDDTLLYRTALLLEEIEGVKMLKEIQFLLKKLPISDVAHLRNEINQPPFGVKTEVPMLCPSCTEEFKIDLPLETSFFFPRKKEEKAQA